MNPYFNPNAAAPQIGYQPQGALGGGIHALRNMQYERLMGLQELLTQHEEAKQREDRYEGYQARKTKRDKEVGENRVAAGVANEALLTPEYNRTRVQGQMGRDLQDHVTGTTAAHTMQGNIDATNTKNLVTSLESAGRSLELAHAANPIESQGHYQRWKATLPPQIQRLLPPDYQPGMSARFQQIADALKNTPQHRGVMEGKEHDKSAQIGVATLNNEAALGRELVRERSLDNRERIRQQAESRSRENKNQAVARLRKTLAANPNDEEAVNELRDYANEDWGKNVQEDVGLMLLRTKMFAQEEQPERREQYRRQYEEEKARWFAERGFYLKAPKKGTRKRFPDGSTREWRGGYGKDPADPNNWTKVN